MATNTSNTSAKRWQDQLILLLGLWFFITPWVFGYPIPSVQAWTAFISGAVIALLAAFDLYKTYFWAVTLNLLLGLAGNVELMWNSLIVGVAVAVLALWEMRTDPELVKHWPGAGHAT